MLPKTFLTQLIPVRIAEAVRRLESSIWRPLTAESAKISVFANNPSEQFREFAELKPQDFFPMPEGLQHWGPKYAQRWYKLVLPPPTDGAVRYLTWNEQSEGTAYIDGVPYSGLDVAHTHTPIPTGTKEIYVDALCIRSGIALVGEPYSLDEEGARYFQPTLSTRDDAAWETYFDLKVLLDLLECEFAEYQPTIGETKHFTNPVRYTPPVFRASPLFRRLCAQIDAAIDVFNRDGVAAFRLALQAIYKNSPAEKDPMKAVLTGHAHIDLVWLWPERVAERKALHSWATQVRLLRQYPEYRFGYSQPASYEAVERMSPALHDTVKSLIKSRQWDATGASYVECDTQIPCGEALLRSLRIGQQIFAELRGGEPSKVFWLPDVFGYSGCMPQLLAGLGVKGFFTSKLSWSSINRFPHTSFRWRSPDGSEIASHIAILHDYNESVSLKSIREDAFHHQQAAVHGEFIQPTGYGDGGGGATEAMIERARRVADLSGVPQTQWGNIEPFFDRLDAVKEKLPVVVGELLLELHRGVFTTHGSLKSAFRGLERALQVYEAAHVLKGGGPIPVHLWKRAAFSHFHDYIPGSSIWEVYAEGIPELRQLADEAHTAAAQALQGQGAGLFNPLPFATTAIAGGKAYTLPPLSGAPFSELPALNLPTPKATAHTLESDRVRASFDDKGWITSLAVDGVAVPLRPGVQLVSYPDHPTVFPAWDVDRTSLVSGQGQAAECLGDAAIATSPQTLTASLSFDFKMADSAARVRYSLTAGEPVLRVQYQFDWQTPHAWVKAVFATDCHGSMARFGAPFGSTLRSQWPGYPSMEANWEVPASRWMALSDDAQQAGLSVVTKDKYGFTVYDSTVGVSLLRSADITESAMHPQIRPTPRPMFSDIGAQTVEIALGGFRADCRNASHPAALADALYTPAMPYGGPSVNAGLLRVENAPSLEPSWAEPLPNGAWVLRLHEVSGCNGTAVIQLASGWQAEQCSFSGEPVGTVTTGELRVPFTQYKIISVKFSRI